MDVLNAISDKLSLSLFLSVASGKSDPDLLKKDLSLTPKQYYSRLSALSKNALVKKYEGKLRLTSFGKLVYDAQSTIEKGLQDLVKLKVIDSLEADSTLSKEECDNILNTLIQNQEIKAILEKRFS